MPIGTLSCWLARSPYIAHFLVHSFDYYERRLHLRQDERLITLLICEQHDTCVPVRVEALFQRNGPSSYEPYQVPTLAAPGRQRTALDAHVLLGQLPLEMVNPMEALAPFAPSTRADYLAKLRSLRTQKRGRHPSL